jgi:hypothetical protein
MQFIAKSLKVVVLLSIIRKPNCSIFDDSYLAKFTPIHLKKFVFSPSVGASGGLITIWNDNLFDGSVVLINSFSITVKLTSSLSMHNFHITNIYGMTDPVEKPSFISWLYNFDTSNIED